MLTLLDDAIVTETVVVETSKGGEKWQSSGDDAGSMIAAMAEEEAARTVLDVQLVYNTITFLLISQRSVHEVG